MPEKGDKTNKDIWKIVHKDMTKEGLKQSYYSSLHYSLAKDQYTTTRHDDFLALSIAVRDRIVERWIETQQNYHKKNVKRVYYLSMEFLIGRLLVNNVMNLGLIEQAEQAMKEFGVTLEEIAEEEADAGLGNGGLGRLAACFLDSMATLGIPGHGYGIRYDYGIFQQKILDGYQVEAPEEWLKKGNPWEFQRPEYAVTIKYNGENFVYTDHKGRLRHEWVNTQDVIAMPYDIPIPGYGNDTVNTLRLWSARSSEEFDLEYFNTGDYEKAVFNKMFTENISKVLYPNDATSMGRELRLKQEYFFTAASVADILRRFKVENEDLTKIPEKIAIQLNDTHPALAVAEFMRLLLDDELLDWDSAWDIIVKTFAYTNHTVLPEALETWAVPLFENLLPRHMQIIYEINARFMREVANQFPGDNERLRRMSLIEEGYPKKVRMAFLAIVGSHSINGVSKLHSELLVSQLFKDFHEVFPERFNNKTNGITPRRWLISSNPNLSGHITKSIGKTWTTDLRDLKKLEKFQNDRAFHDEWRRIKAENKKHLADYVYKTQGMKLNVNSMFDVQVKRIHEYKRQLLFAFYIISEYLRLKENPREKMVPRTFIFGGKAAPGYTMAKLIIKFITSIASVINHDKATKDTLKVVFLENYRVSLAEKIFPASDLSEQISTAGKEASGTGCMKFMMNGALTVGTLDGANIEIRDAAGAENVFIFGLNAEEVQRKQNEGYRPQEYIAQSAVLSEIFRMIRTNFFSPLEPDIFVPLLQNLMKTDTYLICADFDAYCQIQKRISENYSDQEDWTRKSILNVARSPVFSSDRTIREYADEVWGIPQKKGK